VADGQNLCRRIFVRAVTYVGPDPARPLAQPSRRHKVSYADGVQSAKLPCRHRDKSAVGTTPPIGTVLGEWTLGNYVATAMLTACRQHLFFIYCIYLLLSSIIMWLFILKHQVCLATRMHMHWQRLGMHVLDYRFSGCRTSNGGNAPKTCVCPYVVYKSVVGYIVGSNIEAPSVSGYTHAHAPMTLRHACSRSGFVLKSSTAENLESIGANTYYYLLVCHNQTQRKIKVH
jgi:cytochrome c oxidase subunit IV